MPPKPLSGSRTTFNSIRYDYRPATGGLLGDGLLPFNSIRYDYRLQMCLDELLAVELFQFHQVRLPVKHEAQVQLEADAFNSIRYDYRELVQQPGLSVAELSIPSGTITGRKEALALVEQN